MTDRIASIGRLTVDIWPDAGRMLGVSRGTAYEMARAGTLPTIRCGRRLVVPIARLKAMLGEAPEGKRDGNAA